MYGWFTNKLRWVHALSLLVVFLPNVLKSNVKVVPHDFFPHNHPLMLI
jgi:multisubunit Na+/H+ antiporter MnhE subunit